MHLCKEAQPDGREASVPWSLTYPRGVSVSANHHLASFSKEPQHFSPAYLHCCIRKSKTAFLITVPKNPLRIMIHQRRKHVLALQGSGHQSAINISLSESLT